MDKEPYVVFNFPHMESFLCKNAGLDLSIVYSYHSYLGKPLLGSIHHLHSDFCLKNFRYSSVYVLNTLV